MLVRHCVCVGVCFGVVEEGGVLAIFLFGYPSHWFGLRTVHRIQG